jgi:anhydro-N-acetylmuramic acid kinase
MVYIGLMSGTSMDGIDAALVRFGDPGVELLATYSHPYPDTLRHALGKAVMTPPDEPIPNLGALDRQVGERFRDAATELLRLAGVDASEVRAIGSHGQTVRHQPDGPRPYTLQIGNPDLVAQGTGIVTVGDFRSADIAAGGQGAPLVPPFHDWLFGGVEATRLILNIGGIANITILGAGEVRGFDTGPGNTLLDAWIRRHRNLPLDRGGEWAGSGHHLGDVLERLLRYEYFGMEPPKSTGVEEFNLAWLGQFDVDRYDPVDVQATLAELSARSIADHVRRYAAEASELYVCGGGAHNADLIARLGRNLPEIMISSTADVGLDPDWVEAVAFAWLAMRTMGGLTGNLPSVTGASRKVVLGTIHSP